MLLRVFIAMGFCVLSSCDELISVEVPNSKISNDLVFADDASANSALAGIYITMYQEASFAGGSVASVPSISGLSADELTNNPAIDQVYREFELNAIKPSNSYVLGLWGSMYQSIYQANAVLEGLSSTSSGVTMATTSQLKGEALFIRAFCYFYLTNIFGEVPLITNTDYRLSSKLHRSTVDEVYQQIKDDLIKSEDFLREQYPNGERIRPNKFAATSLLARVFLYTGDWARAEEKSTNVINRTTIYKLSDSLNHVFLANSSETIWQLRPPDGSSYTNEGFIFGPETGPKNNVLTRELVSAFDVGDKRRVKWVADYTSSGKTIYLPFKYREHQLGELTGEYSMVLRLAEVYLIRAEARTRQKKLFSAIEDIDRIRKRAGVSLIKDAMSDVTESELDSVIRHERQIELFAEWGHRWFDLKRWDLSATILGQMKPNWSQEDKLYPIPQSEINKNSNLMPQNIGY